MSFWRWFLTCYLIYIGIYIYLQLFGIFYSRLIWILLATGNLSAIFFTYRFIENSKIGWNKLFRYLTLVAFIIFIAFNTLAFSFYIINNTTNNNYVPALLVLDIVGLIFPLISLYPTTKTLVNIKFNIKKIPLYFWKTYLWIWGLVFSLALFTLFFDISKWTLYDYLANSSLILLVVAICSYIFRKVVFSTRFWQIYFWISIVWNVGDLIYNLAGLEKYIPIPDYLKSYAATQPELPLFANIIFILLVLPLYYPIYKIALDKNFFKKN